jgi:hypothetical protein
MVTYNIETWTLTKKNKSKIQAMNMKFLRSIEGQQAGMEQETKVLEKEMIIIF